MEREYYSEPVRPIEPKENEVELIEGDRKIYLERFNDNKAVRIKIEREVAKYSEVRSFKPSELKAYLTMIILGEEKDQYGASASLDTKIKAINTLMNMVKDDELTDGIEGLKVEFVDETKSVTNGADLDNRGENT